MGEKPIQVDDALANIAAPATEQGEPQGPPSGKTRGKGASVPNAPRNAPSPAVKAKDLKKGERYLYAISVGYGQSVEPGRDGTAYDPEKKEHRVVRLDARLRIVFGVCAPERRPAMLMQVAGYAGRGRKDFMVYEDFPVGGKDFDRWFDEEAVKARNLDLLTEEQREAERERLWQKICTRQAFGVRFGTVHELPHLAYPIMPNVRDGVKGRLYRGVNLNLHPRSTWWEIIERLKAGQAA